MHHAHRFNRPLAIDLLEDQFKLMTGHVVKCLIIDGRNSRLTFLRAYDAVTGEDFVDADALREAWREVCLRARDAGNLLERPVMSGGELAASLDWGNYRA